MHNKVLRNNALRNDSGDRDPYRKIVIVLLTLIWLEILWVEGVLTALVFLPMFMFAELSYAIGDSNGFIAGALGGVSVIALIVLSFRKPEKMVFVLFAFAGLELWNCILNAPIEKWTDPYFMAWPIMSMCLCVCVFFILRHSETLQSNQQP